MLNLSEKAYVMALRSLKQRDYGTALSYFDQASERFGGEKEFNLLRETTRVLVAVKNELAGLRAKHDSESIIEEVFNGQETDFSG